MLLSGSPKLWLVFAFALCFVIGSAYADGGPQLDAHKLDMDTAQMRFVLSNESSADFNTVALYGVTLNCWKCDPQYLLSIGNTERESGYANLTTQWANKFRVVFNLGNNTIDHEFSYHLYEHGSYTLEVSTDGLQINVMWRHDVDAQAITTFIPLIVSGAVLVCLAILIPISMFVFSRINHRETSINHYENDREEPRQRTRVASLDVFRGGCLTVMIFVNYGGGGYWFFNHSYWNGLTVADLLFPWFIFIMGVAMPLSFQAMLKKGTSKTQLGVKMIRRTIILFSLGLFINNGAEILLWRIPGVLQRFAVSYLFTGFIILFIPTLAIGAGKNEPDARGTETEQLLTSRTPKYKSSLLPFLAQWAFALLLLSIWFLVTFLLPVPGCPTGYMGPGGISEGGKYYNCTGGAARYIDKKIFGLNHIYDSPTCQPVYLTGSYDPEGFLGCFTSIFLCFLGVQAGRIIQVHAKPKDRLLRWTGWGVFWGGLGTLLCLASQNDGWIPINKNLWTPSFIFVMAGLGYLAFALCYIVVDVWRIWNGAPFLFVGMNSILIYVGHETLNYLFPFSFYTGSTSSSHALNMASNLIGVGSWVIIAYKMYLNKFFVNI